MSHWNYRVIEKQRENERFFEIHEVYYDDKCRIDGWTEEPVHPCGESVKELKADIEYFLRAFKATVLKLVSEEGKEKLIEEEYDPDINLGHYFEIMDRVSVATDYWQDYIASHPVCRKEKEIKEKVEKIIDLMSDLYQITGRLYFDKEENNGSNNAPE